MLHFNSLYKNDCSLLNKPSNRILYSIKKDVYNKSIDLPVHLRVYFIFESGLLKQFLKVKKLFISIILIFISISFQAQQKDVIRKSQIVEVREGKRYYVHTVLAGQTVYSIAKEYEVSVDEIYFENPESRDGIAIDQQLWIPVISKETELNKELRFADYEYFYHIAEFRETFGDIAKIYNIPEKYIRIANADIKEPLRYGVYIKIPAESAFNKLDGTSDHRGEVDVRTDVVNETVSFDPTIPVIPDFRHVVGSGETTKSIADKYDVEVQTLKAVNVGLGNTVKSGDRLRIPQVEKKEKKLEYINYRVKRKETLYSISRQYGLKVKDLYEANKGLTENISEGQIIRIPKKFVSDEYLIHNIKYKTKLKKLAKLYGIPVYEITDANPGIGKRLYPGQQIKIPIGDKVVIADEESDELDIIVIGEEDETDVSGQFFKKDCSKNLKPNKKRLYKVALMIPLYLEENDSLDIQQFLLSEHDNFSPFRFITFYEGVLIAVDSLKKQGMNIELHVYDVDQSIIKASKVLQNRELRNMDLIIGPFFSRNFDQVAVFAGNFGIPIINPFSFREEIIDKYKTVLKVKPGEKYQLELIQKLMPVYYDGAAVFLISQTSYKAADKVIEIQNTLSEVIPTQVAINNNDLYNLGVAVAHRNEDYNINHPIPVFTVEGREMHPDILSSITEENTQFANTVTKINYSVDSLYPFFRKASALRKNLVIIYGDNKAFVMDVMNRLNEYRDTFDIQLIGVPTWERFDGLDQTQCSNLNLTYFSSVYPDYTEEKVQDVVYKFRQRYKVEPGLTGLTGFDVTYYFLTSLFYLDKRYNDCLSEFPIKMTQNLYHFNNSRNNKNYDNRNWNVLRHDRLKLTKINLPN